jgi:hypothetical protein
MRRGDHLEGAAGPFRHDRLKRQGVIGCQGVWPAVRALLCCAGLWTRKCDVHAARCLAALASQKVLR